MASTNFATLRHRCLDALYADRSIVRGTCTGGALGTIVDSAAALPGATTDHFDYAWIKITSTTDNLAPQGEIRAISEGGYVAASGTFNTEVDFTVAPASGDTYEIHYGPHPNWLDRLLNKYARNFHYKTFWPLSLDIATNDDNDMESSLTTNYATSGATITKNTSNPFNGKQNMIVTDSGSGGGYAYATVAPYAGRGYYSSVMVRMAGTTEYARLRIVNAALATIEESASVNPLAWTALTVPWTAPSPAQACRVEFISTTASGTPRFDDYQTWAQDDYTYPLPSWITRKDQIKGVVAYPSGASGAGGDSDFAGDMAASATPIDWRYDREDYSATDEIRIWVPSPGESRPYVIAERPVAETTYDYGTAGVGAGALGSPANTVPLDSQTADLLVAGVLSEAFRELAAKSNDSSHYDSQAKYYKELWDRGMGYLKPPERVLRSNRTMVRMD